MQRQARVTRFKQNPYWYAMAVFEPPKSGRLKFTSEDLESFLGATYNDVEVTTLGPNEDINGRWHPSTSLKMNPQPWEVEDYLKHCQNKSVPGPNGAPYVEMFLVESPSTSIVASGVENNDHCIVDECQIAAEICIPKEKEAKTPLQFRPISPLNVEG